MSFLGFKEKALSYIQNADALVICSSHEGIPYVLLEALILGTPVVATAVGGIPEVITDGIDGLLVNAADPYGLANALQRLLTDTQLRERIRVSGKQQIEKNFTAASMCQGYKQVYTELIR